MNTLTKEPKGIKTKTNLQGITALTSEKHKFNGFSIRRTKLKHRFQRYVSASLHKTPIVRMTQEARTKAARACAVEALATLDRILAEKSSWATRLGKTKLTKKTVLELQQLGFKVKFPAE